LILQEIVMTDMTKADFVGEEKHTPGPWTAYKASMPQLHGDWYAARNISPRPSFSHYEQMRDQEGQILMFKSELLARAAIAKATGQ